MHDLTITRRSCSAALASVVQAVQTTAQTDNIAYVSLLKFVDWLFMRVLAFTRRRRPLLGYSRRHDLASLQPST
jgi:hypothetical protein